MSLEVKIPAVGESITSGLISTWHKNEGDAVAAGDVLLTLETDKVSTELTAERGGVLKIKVPAGTEVKIGEVVGSKVPRLRMPHLPGRSSHLRTPSRRSRWQRRGRSPRRKPRLPRKPR